jgi:hypothetical protein
LGTTKRYLKIHLPKFNPELMLISHGGGGMFAWGQ